MTIHRVSEGETISSIAQKYNTAVALIEHDNGKEFYVGARLIIRDGIILHVVRPFQTLSQISRQYGVSAEHISELNRLKTDLLYAGQQLVISE